ncbi:hypothetical protein MMYC01_200894 [Madurella mycetomatis]|uniref:Oil body-associated protein 1A n=1 Tax=Madurella mycetomatis TaxID=100816 RepID=A0A175WI46_9PEZI|nr:hypothetical protein MMYC01_200894 [Madurella mycetomatis]
MESITGAKDRGTESDVPGEPRSTKNTILETGAAMTQDFSPLQNICAHLNAFHVYTSDPTRFVEANHYCGHLTDEVRQCLLYDSASPRARLIGVEYMITPNLYSTLPQDERRLWHSHVFEVKSGMLIMPQPNPLVPQAVWDKTETAEVGEVAKLYGKVYHLWQVDRGDKLPLGEPQLMTSITEPGQLNGLEQLLDERDKKFPGCDWRKKKEIRKGIEEPEIHPDADYTWKKA